MSYRVGIGYDIHRLVNDRKLLLGGLEIPYVKGLFGHSDGDCLTHAICDALLGSISEGDIGEHFPDTDLKYQDVPSLRLLKSVLALVQKKGYKIVNLDTVIIAEEPKLSPFKGQIRENLAKLLGLEPDCIGVKAKTNEGLDASGKKEAIVCYATVLVEKQS